MTFKHEATGSTATVTPDWMAADSRQVLVSSVQTPPQNRGQGGAHAVMRQVEDYLDHNGLVGRLVTALDRGSPNVDLKSLYAAHGFVESRRPFVMLRTPRIGRALHLGDARPEGVAGVPPQAGHATPQDPTGTTKLRAEFCKALAGRWRALDALAQDAITKHALLGKPDVAGILGSANGLSGASGLTVFQRWFDEALRQIVMGGDGAWTASYVARASRAALSSVSLTDYDPDEPRDPQGKWSSGGGRGYQFASPNEKNLDFPGAVAGLKSQRQSAALEASRDVDSALGLDAKDASIIGAWADGAENSVMTTVEHSDLDKLRTAAAMKGHLENQKQTLIFQEDKAGSAKLFSFDAQGDAATIHSALIEDGVAFHTLVPNADGTGAKVYVVDLDGGAVDAVGKAATRFGTTVDYVPGHAEFIGTQKEDGTDDEQRQDARRAYEDVIRQSPVSGAAGDWQRIHNRWSPTFSRLKDFEPDEARDPQGRWTVGGESRNDDTVSTRIPTGVKVREGVHSNNDLSIGTASVMSTPDSAKKNADLIKSYPFMRTVKGETPQQTADRFVGFVKSNVEALYDAVPPTLRARSKLWYDGANKIAHTLAAKYGIESRAAAGVLASLSPQMPWDQNVEIGKRVMDIWSRRADIPFDKDIEKYAKSYVAFQRSNGDKLDKAGKSGGDAQRASADKMEGLIKEFKGKTLGDLDSGDSYKQAVFLRWVDEAKSPDKSYPVITPEGGEGGKVKTGTGADARFAWHSFDPIAKSIDVMRNPSRENISATISSNHKVRSFYNNIVAPNSPGGHITVDTHAIAAGLLQPLGSDAPEVKQGLGLGGSKSAASGSKGLYGLYADGYREAAKERGVLPREMQSIVWEAGRGLFSSVAKRDKKYSDSVKDIWSGYQRGEYDQPEAQRRVLATGIEPPEWSKSNPAHDAGRAHAADGGNVYGAQSSGSSAGGVDGGGLARNAGSSSLPTLTQVTALELGGICAAVSQQVSRAIGDAIVSRAKPAITASQIGKVIRNVGAGRSTAMANYMVVKTYAATSLDAYRAQGVTHVGTIAEQNPKLDTMFDAARKTPQKRHGKTGQFTAFRNPPTKKQRKQAEQSTRALQNTPGGEVDVLTAEDDRVCEECQSISDNGPYDIDEALSLIPAHINCRCVFVPVRSPGGKFSKRLVWHDGGENNDDRGAHAQPPDRF